MSNLVVTGPINSGTQTTYNDDDPRKSRTVVDYLVTEEDATVANLTIQAAITKSLSHASGDTAMLAYVYGDAPLQGTTAKRMGPRKVRVSMTFARTDLREDSDGREVFTARMGLAYETVYRKPYKTIPEGDNLVVNSESGAINVNCDGTPRGTDPAIACATGTSCYSAAVAGCRIPAYANGLPNGDFATIAGPFNVPSAIGAKPSEQVGYPWGVPEIKVSIPGRLTATEFAGLYAATGAQSFVGQWNLNNFTWGPVSNQIVFPAKTLRFVGATSNWSNVRASAVGGFGTTSEFYVNYNFLWRPSGWYRQDIIENRTSGFGKMDTVTWEYVDRRFDFAGKFPI